MKLHGVWVDTVVEKPTIWRCRCGAMLSTQKAMLRHVAGDTMCQHRGEGMVAYVPESPGPEAGSEGAIPKQQPGLHDDELLVEKVAEAMKAAPASDDWLSEAEAAIAAVRGAVPSEQQEDLYGALQALKVIQDHIDAASPLNNTWGPLLSFRDWLEARVTGSAVPLLQDGDDDV